MSRDGRRIHERRRVWLRSAGSALRVLRGSAGGAASAWWDAGGPCGHRGAPPQCDPLRSVALPLDGARSSNVGAEVDAARGRRGRGVSPMAARRPCPGCRVALITRGQRRCSACDRAYEQRRGSPSARGYEPSGSGCAARTLPNTRVAACVEARPPRWTTSSACGSGLTSGSCPRTGGRDAGPVIAAGPRRSRRGCGSRGASQSPRFGSYVPLASHAVALAKWADPFPGAPDMSRPRTPSGLHQLRGTWRADRHGREPQPTLGVPPPSARLPRDVRERTGGSPVPWQASGCSGAGRHDRRDLAWALATMRGSRRSSGAGGVL